MNAHQALMAALEEAVVLGEDSGNDQVAYDVTDRLKAEGYVVVERDALAKAHAALLQFVLIARNLGTKVSEDTFPALDHLNEALRP